MSPTQGPTNAKSLGALLLRRLRAGVVPVIVVMLAISVAVAFISRHGVSLAGLVTLSPPSVWHGRVWRLVTWSFVESSPLLLVFRCLAIYWLGSDLCEVWTARKFQARYFATVVIVGAITCVLALLDRDIAAQTYAGGYAIESALVVMWGLRFPERRILIYFVIPIAGRLIAWGTVAVTVLVAVFYGWEHVLPALIAVSLAVMWRYRGELRKRWRARASAATRARAAATKNATPPIPAHYDVPDEELAPLSPADEAKLKNVLGKLPGGDT